MLFHSLFDPVVTPLLNVLVVRILSPAEVKIALALGTIFSKFWQTQTVGSSKYSLIWGFYHT